jgi:hypothetical protein
VVSDSVFFLIKLYFYVSIFFEKKNPVVANFFEIKGSRELAWESKTFSDDIYIILLYNIFTMTSLKGVHVGHQSLFIVAMDILHLYL